VHPFFQGAAPGGSFAFYFGISFSQRLIDALFEVKRMTRALLQILGHAEIPRQMIYLIKILEQRKQHHLSDQHIHATNATGILAFRATKPSN
jgi:hypothetical protein